MVGLSATARVRRTGGVFSNLKAAKYFAGELRKIEEKDEVPTADRMDPASYYFFATITACVATLEAYYNALIEDLGHDREVTDLLDKADILAKYSWLLRLANKQPVDRSKEPAQGLRDLLTLRNSAVHYRPRWDDDPVESKKLEKQFRGRNLNESNLFAQDMPFFPYRCCSHQYAEWAIQTVENFLREFTAQMRLEVKWLEP